MIFAIVENDALLQMFSKIKYFAEMQIIVMSNDTARIVNASDWVEIQVYAGRPESWRGAVFAKRTSGQEVHLTQKSIAGLLHCLKQGCAVKDRIYAIPLEPKKLYRSPNETNYKPKEERT